jgi:capsular polysaccharide export protein
VAVLFLQGPMGPFFRKLIHKLRERGARAYKINFNGGDEWYSRGVEATSFTGKEVEWPQFLRDFIIEHNVNSVCVFGDCRRYHRTAKAIAHDMEIGFYAFEEGYIRPNHITFERNGVNGYSEIEMQGLLDWQEFEIEPESAMGGTLLNRMRYCFLYYNLVAFRASNFPHYIHHRSLSRCYEMSSWLKALGRHYLYRITERKIQKHLVKNHDKEYFLVPLQVYNDAQIRFHSPYESIEIFIRQLMESFAENGDPKDILVFKHHPMDRGHCHYGELIKEWMEEYGLVGRVMYCHDQHLPTLLSHAKGVVTINSTTALSAFYHNASVKVMGDAFYDIDGLCSQQSLEEFWQKPKEINYELFLRLRSFLVNHGQVNGSYYRKHRLSTDTVIDQMHRNNMLEE